MADSRPDPGPFTKTSTSFTPMLMALLAASSAAICAAKGVAFLEPLNLTTPVEDQHRVFPLGL